MDDDPLIALARRRGWLDEAGLARLHAEQRALAERGVSRSLWLLAQDLGLVSEERARDVQRSTSSATNRALTVDGWTLAGRVGAGGMGDVYRAVAADGRQAAVKLLLSRLARDQEHVRRFAREARASLRLRHPHIVASLAAGAHDGTRYLVMELVEGPSLKTRLLRDPLRPAEALVLLAQAAAGLAQAWAGGVLHRDVKPANLLLAPPRPGVDEPFCAMVCDFGLAKVRPAAGEGDESPGQLTAVGMALGTPHYMAPEQASGEAGLDARADMYGLAASVVHAVTGATLFSGKSSAAIMYQQVATVPDLGRLEGRGLDPRLIALLRRMLAKRRDDRPADWAQVLAEVAAIAPAMARVQAEADARYVAPPLAANAHGPSSEVLPALPSRPEPDRGVTAAVNRARRRRVALGVGGAVAVVLLLAAAAVLIGLRPRPALRADPATLAGILATVDRPVRIDLAPGRYAGIRLGRAHAGLRLHAGPDGPVVMVGAPAVRIDPGGSVRLEGLALLAQADAPALVVAAGASAALVRTTVDAAATAAVIAGRLDAESVVVHSQEDGIAISVGGAVHGQIRVVARGDGIVVDHGLLQVNDVQISASRAGVRVDGGTVRIDGGRLSAPQGVSGRGDAVLDRVVSSGP